MKIIKKLQALFGKKKETKKSLKDMVVVSDQYDCTALLGDSAHRYWHIGRYMPESLMNETTQVYIRTNGVLAMMMFYIWGACSIAENHIIGFRMEIGQSWVDTDNPSYGFFYGSSESLSVYKEWESNYLARFAPSYERELLPSMPNSFTIRGTAFDHNGIHYNNLKKYVELLPPSFDPWIWIVENCKGKVFVTDKSFIFENDEDAVLYKLQYLSK